ncbi:MAG: hypothetical protein ACPG4X_20795, partial [Pikeienuella sp.]
MAMVEFVGQSARDSDNVSSNTSRLLNCYREPVVPGGATGHVLKSVLGQEAFADLSTVLLRDMQVVDGMIYAAAGGALYEVSSAGVSTNRGAVPDDENTSIAGNFGSVAVVSGGTYSLWDGTALTTPTGGAFTNFGSVCYVGGYSVFTQLNGRQFQWSALADASTLDALNFQTADSRDDKNIRGVALNGRLLVFKERSIETWYITGQAGANVFGRVAGGTIDTGLKDFNLLAEFPGGIFFVGDDGIVYLMSGALQPVSTPPVETAVSQSNPTHCYLYEDEGHKFLCIRFSDRPTWCYDLSTGEWHERAEGRLHGPWSVTTTVELGGNWYAGNINAVINRLARTNEDLGDELRNRAVSFEVYNDGQRFKVAEVEILGRV